MASPAQMIANQANSALSTGPGTVEGKAASSHDALAHGATSRQTVLAWESQSRFDSLAADTQAHYQPQGHLELALTTLVAVTFWRYNRMMRIEADFMSAVDPGGVHPEAAVAALFADPAGARKLSLVLRYLANASREWRNAVTELRRVQKENRAALHEPADDGPPADASFALDLNRPACHDSTPEAVTPESLGIAASRSVRKSETSEPRQLVPVHVNRAERRAFDGAHCNAEKRASSAEAVPSIPTPIGFDSYSAPSAA